jgi:nucleotide-binding universal stress UspA family protein
MNTILVLTDFSENANHAAKAALPFAKALHSDILIFNSYYNQPAIPAYAGGPLSANELILQKKDSTSRLHQLTRQLSHFNSNGTGHEFKPQIYSECGEGPLGNNITTIINKNQVSFIVMGSSLNSPLNHLFFGSDTMDVVDHALCPVLIVPPKATLKKLKKITLATAFEPFDDDAITYLAKLNTTLNFEMEIVHVSVFEKYEDPDKEKALFRHLKKFEASGIHYKQVRGKDVIDRLNRLCKENGSDVLALVHYEHGFLSGIFKKSTTEKALGHHHIPLMVIPADMSK